MPRGNLQRFAPLTGVLFVVLIVIAFVLGGETPDFDDPPEEVVDYFVDNDTVNIVGSLFEGLGAVVLLFFAAYLARTVGAGILAWVVLGGGIVAAAGIGVDAGLRFALTEAAGEVAPDGAIEPGTVQALNALWANFFFPMVVGLGTLVLATSLAALRTRVIPVWLAWIGIVLFVVFFTPAGFVAFLVSGLWIIVISIILWRREGVPGGMARPAA
jgi:hypothetical protein